MSDVMLKKAAEELLKIANDMEKEAAEVTQFVCDKCSHTATLASINSKRQASAKEAGENVLVADVTVNDKIHCPACEGIMAYSETEASSAYYYDPDKKAAEEEKEEKKEKEAAKVDHSEKTETPAEEAQESVETQKQEREKGVHASIDYDSLTRYTK